MRHARQTRHCAAHVDVHKGYSINDLKDAAKRVNCYDGGITEAERIAARMFEDRKMRTPRPAPTIRHFSWEQTE